QMLAQVTQGDFVPTSAHSSDLRQFQVRLTSLRSVLARHLFFCAQASCAGETDSLGWSRYQGIGQFFSSALDRLFIETGDLREQAISSSPHPLRLHCDIPAA